MTPLTILPTASAHPADCSESDSGIGGSQTLHKTKEAAHRQPPGSATSDKGCEERTSLARSGLTNIDGRGPEPIKSRRKSTGGILTCISALHCFFPANPDPSFGPPYTERFLPLDQHPHFQVQIKSGIKKEPPGLSTISASLPADGVPGEAFVSISTNGTDEVGETVLGLDNHPRPCPRSQYDLPTWHDELNQSREGSATLGQYSNKFFEIKKSGLSGLGAFALQDLKMGQMILTEPVLLKANSLGIYNEYDKLTPTQQRAYNGLCSHCPRHATGLERIRNIYDTNSFNMGDGQCGVYLATARFNHACPPASNVAYSFKGARQDITLRMTKDVRAGTELTLTYATCKVMLYRNWGFVCSCGGCTPLGQEELAFINTPPTW